MKKKTILIQINNEQININPDMSLPIQHTNIPVKDLKFRTSKEIFWEVEQMEYDGTSKCLKVKVINYHAKKHLEFNSQIPKKELLAMHFEKLDWVELEPLLTSYHQQNISHFVFNIDKEVYRKYISHRPPYRHDDPQKDIDHIFELEPIEITIQDTIKLDFKELNFGLGCVTFSREIQKLGNEIEFEILNDFILPEFDAIKYWFSKLLKVKRIPIQIMLKIRDGEIIEKEATSTEISRINPDLIDSIKYQRTLAISKVPGIEISDKSLFTAEDVFDELDQDNPAGNIFKQSEEDILQILAEHSHIRNRKHLSYLSGQKQSTREKLRYTLHPNFGFLFFIEGEEKNHFVWELLNSNATYIWSLDKKKPALSLQFKQIENTINQIRIIGREKYKREYMGQYFEDFSFRAIPHEDIHSKFKDGFVKWQSRLNEQLI